MKYSIVNFLALLFFTPFISIANDGPIEEIQSPEHIKTIQFFGNSEFSGTPIIKLGEPLKLTFDDINGNEADYYYKISHYNFDWTPSSLYKNEFLDGFDDVRIFEYENSFNTLQLYSHYMLSIPNQDTRSLKVSGNYMITIYDKNSNPVFSRKFIVYEDLTTTKAYVKRSRNLEFINTRQSVQFEVTSANLILRDPERTVKTMIIQNNDINTAITGLVPQYTITNTLIYKYDQESSFYGGNEFLFFDNKEIRSATANIQTVDLQELYHHYLYADIVRANRRYTYNPDINGNFVVRNLRGDNSNVEADYVWMHFVLECYEALGNGEIHIYGNFNNYTLDESTKLKYDKSTGKYYLDRLFKQGFYNYRYVLRHPDGSIEPGFISGNFDETENEYTIITYYRAPATRYDRIIGVGSANSVNITN